jgi:hypothetical protein
MRKKFAAILIIFIIFSVSSITAFAEQTDFDIIFEKVLNDPEIVENGQIIVDITSPEKIEESTYSKEQPLSGTTKYNDVVVTIARYNEETKTYERIYNVDGNSSWKMGDNRLFTTTFRLNNGKNKIKVLAYRISQMGEAKAENIQVSAFEITLLKEEILQSIKRAASDFVDSIGSLFKK